MNPVNSEFSLVERVPDVADYQRLRRAVGWYCASDDAAARGLAQSLYSACLLHRNSVVGCGRIVGDGGIYFYIQDIIVLPEYQKRGLGKMIMDAVMRYLREHATPNAFVGLMAAQGVSQFYVRYGFAERPADRPGMFLVWK